MNSLEFSSEKIGSKLSKTDIYGLMRISKKERKDMVLDFQDTSLICLSLHSKTQLG